MIRPVQFLLPLSVTPVERPLGASLATAAIVHFAAQNQVASWIHLGKTVAGGSGVILHVGFVAGMLAFWLFMLLAKVGL